MADRLRRAGAISNRNTRFKVRHNVFDRRTGKTLITMAEVP